MPHPVSMCEHRLHFMEPTLLTRNPLKKGILQKVLTIKHPFLMVGLDKLYAARLSRNTYLQWNCCVYYTIKLSIYRGGM